MTMLSDIALFLIAIVFLIVVLVLVWRFLSRRYALPCPTWLIWMLEHRLMERVAGADVIVERAGIKSGMRVLDAGCGPGRLSLPLSAAVEAAGEVVALDLQVPMLARLRENVRERGVSNIHIVHGILGQQAFAANLFDRVIMVTVLGEIPDREGALREIYTCLKPGGILSVTEVLPDPHYQRLGTVKSLGERVGFQIGATFSGVRSFTLNLVKPNTISTKHEGHEV